MQEAIGSSPICSTIYTIHMNKVTKIALITVGILLVFNGILNIMDDGVILTYDITSLLSGVGFLIMSFSGQGKISRGKK